MNWFFLETFHPVYQHSSLHLDVFTSAPNLPEAPPRLSEQTWPCISLELLPGWTDPSFRGQGASQRRHVVEPGNCRAFAWKPGTAHGWRAVSLHTCGIPFRKWTLVHPAAQTIFPVWIPRDLSRLRGLQVVLAALSSPNLRRDGVWLTHVARPRIQEKNSTLWNHGSFVRNIPHGCSREGKTKDRIVSLISH